MLLSLNETPVWASSQSWVCPKAIVCLSVCRLFRFPNQVNLNRVVLAAIAAAAARVSNLSAASHFSNERFFWCDFKLVAVCSARSIRTLTWRYLSSDFVHPSLSEASAIRRCSLEQQRQRQLTRLSAPARHHLPLWRRFPNKKHGFLHMHAACVSSLTQCEDESVYSLGLVKILRWK